MDKISEQKVNDLTKRHVARTFTKIEKRTSVPPWLREIIRTEFWLHNQNLKSMLYDLDIINLDVVDKPWFPNKKHDDSE